MVIILRNDWLLGGGLVCVGGGGSGFVVEGEFFMGYVGLDVFMCIEDLLFDGGECDFECVGDFVVG